MDLKALLGKAAPWLAAAAAGPAGLAGMAIKTVAETLGATDQSAEAVTAALAGASPEQMAALKQADNDFRLRMEELGMKSIADLEALAVADRKNARDMAIAKPSMMPAALSALVTLGYFGILVGMMSGYLKVNDSQALLIMLGSLSTAWGMVMAFWFGTTNGSSRKTDLLAKAPAIGA